MWQSQMGITMRPHRLQWPEPPSTNIAESVRHTCTRDVPCGRPCTWNALSGTQRDAGMTSEPLGHPNHTTRHDNLPQNGHRAQRRQAGQAPSHHITYVAEPDGYLDAAASLAPPVAGTAIDEHR